MKLRTAIVSSALMVLAACGDDDGGDDAATSGDAPSTTEAPADEPSTTTTGAGGDAAGTQEDGTSLVEVVDSEFGPILASEGRTLYAFVPDDGSGASTCYDACIEAWPALLADGAPSAGDGVEAELATTTRDDGGEQVTIEGWPLYFFAGDAAPGDTNGQGVNEIWYVVAPDGSMIQG